RNVLGQGADLLAADVDHDDRVHEMAGIELAEQLLGLDVDRHRIIVAAVDYGGDTAFATQCTGGSLASPFAQLGRQGKSFAHVTCLSKCSRCASPPRLQG